KLITLISVDEQHQSLRRQALRKRLACLLRLRMLVCVRNYLTTASLMSNVCCVWTYMYKSRCEKSFINTVSFDPDTYDLLLQAFSRHYIVRSGPSRRGRPRRFVSKNNVLACVLHLYTAAVELKTLCELFGCDWSDKVSRKEGLIKGCFCVADGKHYAVLAPTNSDLPNAYYN
ncbi:hypothetical protein GN958_ATG03250, partial [Phytophthora infestans]